jgi:hypothetical protein
MRHRNRESGDMEDIDIERALEIVLNQLDRLEEQMNAVNQGLLDLQKAVADETTLDAQIVAAFKALQAQIAALQAQATEVTDAQLEQLAQTLNGAQATLTALVPPATAPPVAGSGPGSTPANPSLANAPIIGSGVGTGVTASPALAAPHILHTTGDPNSAPAGAVPGVSGANPQMPWTGPDRRVAQRRVKLVPLASGQKDRRSGVERRQIVAAGTSAPDGKVAGSPKQK